MGAFCTQAAAGAVHVFQGGVGLATGPTQSFKKGDLISRFLGNHVVGQQH